MPLPTETAENQPTELSGAATQPTRAGSTTTAQVPIAARAPARSEAGSADDGRSVGRQWTHSCGGADVTLR